VQTTILSRVGAEGHGDFVRDFLSAEGIDVSYLRTDPHWPTPPTFCEVWPPDNFPITFYRRPTCPDWQLAPEDFDAEAAAGAPLLFATGTGLAQSPSRETTLRTLAGHRGTTVFDLDWRPTLWDRAEEYPPLAAEAAAASDIVIGNEEEVGAAGLTDVPVLVLKRGGLGAIVYEQGGEVEVPGFPIEVVNGLGAGDAFAAAVGHGLLRGLALVEAVRRGVVAGALVAGELACSEAMPTLEELEAALP
jgi:5-dehydro-2-deoxygluconokinase